MVPRRKIPRGARLPVSLSSAERKLIQEQTFYTSEALDEIKEVKGTIAVEMDLDTIEDLQGYVAAEANHTEDRKLGQKLDQIFTKLQGFLDKYDDQ